MHWIGWLFRTFLLILMVLALYVSVWREGLRLLPVLETQLEVYLSERFSLNADVQAARGHLEGFKPSLRIERLSFYKQQADALVPMLDMRKVQFSIDVLRTLTRGKLVLESLTIKDGSLHIRPGKTRSKTKQKSKPWQAASKGLEWLVQQGPIELERWTVHIYNRQGELQQEVEVAKAQLQLDQAKQLALEMEAKLLTGQRALHLQVLGLFPAQTFGNKTSGELVIGAQLDELDSGLAQPTRGLGRLLMQLAPGLKGQAWLELRQGKLVHGQAWIADGQQTRAQARLDRQGRNALLWQLQAVPLVQAHHSQTDHLQMWSPQLTDSPLQLRGIWSSPYTLGDLQTIAAPSRIDSLVDWLQTLAPLPASLTHLNATGNIEQLQFIDETLHLSMTDFGIEQEQLKLNGLNLEFELQAGAGQGRIWSEQLLLAAPKVFPQSLDNIHLSSSDFTWHSAKRDPLERWRLAFENLHVQHDQLELNSAVALSSRRLSTPAEPGVFEPYLEIQNRLTANDLKHLPWYLPLKLSKKLRSWLEQTLLAGQVETGEILYAGFLKPRDKRYLDGFAGPTYYQGLLKHDQGELRESLQRATPAYLEPTLQLRFVGRDVDFRYLPDWPVLKEARPEVFIGPQQVDFTVPAASLLEQIHVQGQGQVQILPTSTTPQVVLALQADGTGPLATGVNLLRQSPVNTKTKGFFEHLNVQAGSFETRVMVNTVLGQPKPDFEVTTKLTDGSLAFAPADLQFDALQAQTRFDLQHGLQASSLSTSVFGQPWQGLIYRDKNADRTIVSANGGVTVQALTRWRDWFFLPKIHGKTALSAELSLPWRAELGNVELALKSNLLGISIDAPGEFGKDQQTHRRWSLQANFGATRMLAIEDKGLYRFDLAVRDGELRGLNGYLGEFSREQLLALSSNATTHSWFINLPKLDLKPWLNWFDSTTTAVSSEPVRVDEPKALLPYIPDQLSFASRELYFGETPLYELKLSANKEPKGVRLQWDGDLAGGEGFVPLKWLQAQQPERVRLTFDRLLLPKTPKRAMPKIISQPAKPTNKGSLSHEAKMQHLKAGYKLLRRLPVLELEIKAIEYAGNNLGRFNLTATPATDHYRIDEFQAKGSELQLHGDGQWQLRDNQLQLELDYSGGKVEKLFAELDMDRPPLTSKSFRGKAALQMQALPWQPSLDQLKGSAELELKSGELLDLGSNVSPLKWLSLLSAAGLAQQLQLNFLDLFEDGLNYTRLHTDIAIDGKRITNSTLEIDAPALKFSSSGYVDFARQSIFQQCRAQFALTEHLVLPAAAAGGLPAAATAFVIDKTFGNQINKLLRMQWTLSGNLAKPSVRTGVK